MKRMHKNSLEAYYGLKSGTRKAQVMQCYIDSGLPLTDMEVGRSLAKKGIIKSEDCVNGFRPRITDLINDGKIIEISDKIKCRVSGKRTRACIPIL